MLKPHRICFAYIMSLSSAKFKVDKLKSKAKGMDRITAGLEAESHNISKLFVLVTSLLEVCTEVKEGNRLAKVCPYFSCTGSSA